MNGKIPETCNEHKRLVQMIEDLRSAFNTRAEIIDNIALINERQTVLLEKIERRLDDGDKKFEKLSEEIMRIDKHIERLEERERTAKDNIARWIAGGAGMAVILDFLLKFFHIKTGG